MAETDAELLKRSVCKDLIQKEGLVAELLRESDPLYGFLILNAQDARPGPHSNCRHRNIVGVLYLGKVVPQFLIFGESNHEVGNSIGLRIAAHLHIVPIVNCSTNQRGGRVYEQYCSACAPATVACLQAGSEILREGDAR